MYISVWWLYFTVQADLDAKYNVVQLNSYNKRIFLVQIAFNGDSKEDLYYLNKSICKQSHSSQWQLFGCRRAIRSMWLSKCSRDQQGWTAWPLGKSAYI